MKINLDSLLPLRAVVVEVRFLSDTQTSFFHQKQIRSFLKEIVGKSRIEGVPHIWIDTPERAQVSFRRTAPYRFCVFCAGEPALELLEVIMNALRRLPNSYSNRAGGAPAFGKNIAFSAFKDYFSLADVEISSAAELNAFGPSQLESESKFWSGERRIRARFLAPARLKSIQRDTKFPYIRDRNQFGEFEFTHRVRRGLENLGAEFDSELSIAGNWSVISDSLFWVEGHSRGPGKRNHNPFGGALGSVELSATGDVSQVTPLLVLGQYTGIGEKRGYGLGRYRLESVPNTAKDRTVITTKTRGYSQGVLDRAISVPQLEKAWRSLSLKSNFKELADDEYNDKYIDENVDPDYHRSISMDFDALVTKVRSAQFRPGPLYGRLLEQPGKSPRALAIPSRIDRLVQRAILEQITPAIDRLFSESSYGFRRGRSRQGARDRVHALKGSGYDWFFESDIASFFDSVTFESVYDRLQCVFADDPVVNLIYDFMTSPVVYQGRTIPRYSGLPQGAPLSPLIANLLLSDFDADMHAVGLKLVRFADDFVVLCRNKNQAQEAASEVSRSLSDVGLKINEGKTRIGHFGDGFRFLGYTFLGDLIVENVKSTADKGSSHERQIADATKKGWLAQFTETNPLPIEEIGLKRSAAGATASAENTQPLRPRAHEYGTTLFVGGASKYLKSKNMRITVVDRDDGVVADLSWTETGLIVLIGRHHISMPLMQRALEENVPIHIATSAGRYLGLIGSAHPTERSPGQWKAQSRCFGEDQKRLALARQIVEVRINNQRAVLRQRSREPYDLRSTLKSLKNIQSRASDVGSIDSLRGLEGRAGALYFREFRRLLPDKFAFEKRVPRNPPDPVNSLLSLGYGVLRAHMSLVLRVSGFYSWNGFYHKEAGTHEALASDMMEPYRHIVERVVLSLILRGQIRPEQFEVSERGCRANRQALRLFLDAMTEKFSSEVRSRGESDPLNIYAHMDRQVRSLYQVIYQSSEQLRCLELT